MPNTLSVRSRFRWRTLDDEVYLADGSEVDFSAARRLFILIHGYNTSQEDAQRAFALEMELVGIEPTSWVRSRRRSSPLVATVRHLTRGRGSMDAVLVSVAAFRHLYLTRT